MGRDQNRGHIDESSDSLVNIEWAFLHSQWKDCECFHPVEQKQELYWQRAYYSTLSFYMLAGSKPKLEIQERLSQAEAA